MSLMPWRLKSIDQRCGNGDILLQRAKGCKIGFKRTSSKTRLRFRPTAKGLSVDTWASANKLLPEILIWRGRKLNLSAVWNTPSDLMFWLQTEEINRMFQISYAIFETQKMSVSQLIKSFYLHVYFIHGKEVLTHYFHEFSFE